MQPEAAGAPPPGRRRRRGCAERGGRSRFHASCVAARGLPLAAPPYRSGGGGKLRGRGVAEAVWAGPIHVPAPPGLPGKRGILRREGRGRGRGETVGHRGEACSQLAPPLASRHAATPLAAAPWRPAGSRSLRGRRLGHGRWRGPRPVPGQCCTARWELWAARTGPAAAGGGGSHAWPGAPSARRRGEVNLRRSRPTVVLRMQMPPRSA